MERKVRSFHIKGCDDIKQLRRLVTADVYTVRIVINGRMWQGCM